MLKIRRFVCGVLRSNCYLIQKEGSSEAVLIDPAKNKAKIAAIAEYEGLVVKAVLLTHGHFDHILEAAVWQSEGIPVYIHKGDAACLAGEGNLGAAFGVRVPPCKADFLLTDGQKFTAAGIEFTAIHTPGHSPGSCCYLAEDCIFSGDTLFAGSYGRYDLPGGDFDALKNSLRRLFALPGDYRVFPGHEEETTLARERVHNMIIGELLP